MGRVAIELHRRGIDVVGVDLDDDLLEFARRTQPDDPMGARGSGDDVARSHVRCRRDARQRDDLLSTELIERRSSATPRAHVDPDGHLVTGFELQTGPEPITLDEYDELCSNAGLELVRHCSTWQGAEYRGENYAVTVHRARPCNES